MEDRKWWRRPRTTKYAEEFGGESSFAREEREPCSTCGASEWYAGDEPCSFCGASASLPSPERVTEPRVGKARSISEIATEMRALGQEWRMEFPDGRECRQAMNRLADELEANRDA